MNPHLRQALRPLAVLAALALPTAASAQVSVSDIVSAELRPGWRQADGRHIAALHLKLAPGWKTYWRAPGAAGIPPVFDWSGSANLGAVQFLWPRPEVFDLSGMQTIGYKHELVLPILFTPKSGSGPIRIEAEVELGVCENICVPVSLSLMGDLPEAGGRDEVISTALSMRPKTGAEAGLLAIGCTIEPIDEGLRVTARISMPSLGAGETVVIETDDPQVWVDSAAAGREGGTLTAVAEMYHASGTAFALDRSAVTLTVLGKGKAVELRGCPAG